jgi:hypothetical protein
MAAPARRLTKAITDYLSYQGILWWKGGSGAVRSEGRFMRFGTPGVSDICALYRGAFLAIEVKAGRDQLTDIQAEWHRKVVKQGGVSIVARDVGDVIREIEDIKQYYINPMRYRCAYTDAVAGTSGKVTVEQ